MTEERKVVELGCITMCRCKCQRAQSRVRSGEWGGGI
jgi:hypothetical protein